VTAQAPREFKGHTGLVYSVAFSPDGKTLATGSFDNTVKLWDTPFSIPLREYAHADGVNAVALSQDGTRIAGAGKDGTIKLWMAAEGKQLADLRAVFYTHLTLPTIHPV